MRKISSRCPLCGEHKIDLIEVYPYDGCQGESAEYVIHCFNCGIRMCDMNKNKLIDRWNDLCLKHALCFDRKLSNEMINQFIDNFTERMSKIISKFNENYIDTDSVRSKTNEDAK